MPDQSFLDDRYFVDEDVYNCPFCNRRHVSYWISDHGWFHWSEKKRCFFFITRCASCRNTAFHLSFSDLELYSCHPDPKGGTMQHRFSRPEGIKSGAYLDQAFFYSVPTSFFVMDNRVPRILRELMTEAEGCLKSNFLTGASACARKLIYELAALMEVSGENYDERIKALKSLHPEVDSSFFDTLLTVQQVTSSKVHESSYDGWEAKHLRAILSAVSEVLHALFVLPAIKEDKRKAMLKLKDELTPPGKSENIGNADDSTVEPQN